MFSSYPLYFLMLCTGVVLASSSQTEEQHQKCSKLLCTPKKATICVKVKDRTNKTTYVMASKCELKIIKCYGDVETTVVPKKHCEGKLKALRQGNMLGDKEDEPVQDTGISEKEDQVGSKDPVKDAGPLGISEDEPANQKDPKLIQENLNQVNSVEEHKPNEEPQEEGSGINPDPPGIQLAEHSVALGNEVTEPDLIEINPEGGEKKDDNDYKQNTLHSDEGDEAGLTCPNACPVRGVMVCARCSHGVFRTFMSSCYMRMYQCKHPKEKLELVSRRACTASAPYLGEMPRPTVLTVEPMDSDAVLNYIFNLHKSPTEIAKRLVDVTGDRRAGGFLAQRISIAIQRGNAASILGTMPQGPFLDLS